MHRRTVSGSKRERRNSFCRAAVEEVAATVGTFGLYQVAGIACTRATELSMPILGNNDFFIFERKCLAIDGVIIIKRNLN
jgi:hypothetical protein